MYQMTPPQPAQLPPNEEENRRLSVPQIMLIVAVLAFAAWYLITTLTPKPAPYATITAGVIGARYTGDCLIVRDETPYDSEGVTSVRYVAEEGSTVYRGSTICDVYSSGFSTREMQTLQDYRNQIKDYQLKLLRSEVATDSAMQKLENDVLTRAREVREIIGGTRGNMENQESLLNAAIQSRQAYLRSKYSNDQRMTRLYDDEQSQLQRIGSWTKQYVAMSEGIVSFYSDGFEYGLTINNFEDFGPAEVRNMLNGNKPGGSTLAKGKTTIYRMVRDGHWYVIMLIKDSTWNPVEGATYQLKLGDFKDTTVDAVVRSFTRVGGEMVVRLSVTGDVTPVLYIRSCTGVLGDNVSSLTVPKRAIYYQDNMAGVVVVENGYKVFIPVNILDERDGMVFISAIQQDVLYEGQTVQLF